MNPPNRVSADFLNLTKRHVLFGANKKEHSISVVFCQPIERRGQVEHTLVSVESTYKENHFCIVRNSDTVTDDASRFCIRAKTKRIDTTHRARTDDVGFARRQSTFLDQKNEL